MYPTWPALESVVHRFGYLKAASNNAFTGSHSSTKAATPPTKEQQQTRCTSLPLLKIPRPRLGCDHAARRVKNAHFARLRPAVKFRVADSSVGLLKPRGDRTAEPRKSDQSRDDLCGAGLRKDASWHHMFTRTGSEIFGKKRGRAPHPMGNDTRPLFPLEQARRIARAASWREQ
jgi:hypothetical protein